MDMDMNIDTDMDMDLTHYNTFEEYADKRRRKILRKIKFNIRNYVFLSKHQIYELKYLSDIDKISIIILLNDILQHYTQTIYSSSNVVKTDVSCFPIIESV